MIIFGKQLKLQVTILNLKNLHSYIASHIPYTNKFQIDLFNL